MEKLLLKSCFGYDKLKEMESGDIIKVACQSWLECNSAKSMCSQFRKSYPDKRISKYQVKTEKQGNGYIVTIEALA